MNKVILSGYVGKDPEIRYSENGKCRAIFSLATNEGFGENKVTDWHTVLTWNKIAENVEKLVRSGIRIEVEGRLKYNKQTGKSYVLADGFFACTTKEKNEPYEVANTIDPDDDDLPF